MTIDRDGALTEPVRRAGWVSAVPSARPRLRFAHRLEAWGAKLAFAIFGWFPLDGASAIGGALGRAIRVFDPCGRVATHGLEHIDRAVVAGRRMIIFSGHIANWEIAMVAAVQYGISVAQIYRAANNPSVDQMITRFRGDGELI